MDGEAIDDVIEAVDLTIGPVLKSVLQNLVVGVHQLLCMSP